MDDTRIRIFDMIVLEFSRFHNKKKICGFDFD